jgi:hypothetical protein
MRRGLPLDLRCIGTLGSTFLRGKGPNKEAPMFEMIDEEKTGPEQRKLFLTKVAAYAVAFVVVAGVVGFFAYFALQ